MLLLLKSERYPTQPQYRWTGYLDVLNNRRRLVFVYIKPQYPLGKKLYYLQNSKMTDTKITLEVFRGINQSTVMDKPVQMLVYK